jgi:hypothetical protein
MAGVKENRPCTRGLFFFLLTVEAAENSEESGCWFFFKRIPFFFGAFGILGG